MTPALHDRESNGPAEQGDSLDLAPSLSSLIERLLSDGRELIRQEILLLTDELRSSARAAARGGTLIGIGATLLLVGLACLLVFVILALGELLGGRFWMSALLVSFIFLVGGATLALRGRSSLRRASIRPAASMESLRNTADWARRETARKVGQS